MSVRERQQENGGPVTHADDAEAVVDELRGECSVGNWRDLSDVTGQLRLFWWTPAPQGNSTTWYCCSLLFWRDAPSRADSWLCLQRGMSERTSTGYLRLWCAVVDAPGGRWLVWWTPRRVPGRCGALLWICGPGGRSTAVAPGGLCWRVYPVTDSRDCTSVVRCVGGFLPQLVVSRVQGA